LAQLPRSVVEDHRRPHDCDSGGNAVGRWLRQENMVNVEDNIGRRDYGNPEAAGDEDGLHNGRQMRPGAAASPTSWPRAALEIWTLLLVDPLAKTENLFFFRSFRCSFSRVLGGVELENGEAGGIGGDGDDDVMKTSMVCAEE
jgi:hypothetical protein